jgi:hypothetical protein
MPRSKALIMIELNVLQQKRMRPQTPLSGRTGLKPFDEKSGHQDGDAVVLISSGNYQLFNSDVSVFELVYSGCAGGLKMAGSWKSPFMLDPAIDVDSFVGIGRFVQT